MCCVLRDEGRSGDWLFDAFGPIVSLRRRGFNRSGGGDRLQTYKGCLENSKATVKDHRLTRCCVNMSTSLEVALSVRRLVSAGPSNKDTRRSAVPGVRCPVSGARSPAIGARRSEPGDRSPELGARSPEPGARRSEPGLCSREEPISGLTCFVHRLQLYSPVLRFGILFNLSPRLIKQFKQSLNELIKEFLLLIPFTVGLYTKSSHCLFRRPTPDVPFSYRLIFL